MATPVQPNPGECGFSKELFRIGPSLLGRLGMFANKNISAGACITKEEEIIIPLELVRARFPLANLSQALVQQGKVQMCGPSIARVNHSCGRWNAVYANKTKVSRELHAVSFIPKGQEITIFFDILPPVMFRQPNGSLESRATNNAHRARIRAALKAQFDLDCNCPDCFTDCSTCWNGCPKVSKMKKCSQCGVAFYCSRQCQHDHWKEHRLSCRAGALRKQEWEAHLLKVSNETEL